MIPPSLASLRANSFNDVQCKCGFSWFLYLFLMLPVGTRKVGPLQTCWYESNLCSEGQVQRCSTDLPGWLASTQVWRYWLCYTFSKLCELLWIEFMYREEMMQVSLGKASWQIVTTCHNLSQPKSPSPPVAGTSHPKLVDPRHWNLIASSLRKAVHCTTGKGGVAHRSHRTCSWQWILDDFRLLSLPHKTVI